MSEKFIYLFGGGKAEGNSDMKEILGGKGANLAEMSSLGLPVPPGFTISTLECKKFYLNDKKLSGELLKSLEEAVKHIEETLGGEVKFGNSSFPLLLSVRSGAPVSMPGMMDTILNLGLNDKTVEALAEKTGNKRFAYDSFRRFIQMYSNVVLEVPHHYFESILDDKKLEMRVKSDSQLSPEALLEIIEQYKARVKETTGEDFPQDTFLQLKNAICAVFLSWKSERAIYYRGMYGFGEEMGTAVTVQAMVFGNLGETSATGVAFTRNPSDGTAKIYGEYLINAQGEDVVAGIRTPYPIDKASKTGENANSISLEEAMPEVYAKFLEISSLLEKHYKDMQDIEFTIQEKKLWFLQTRSGKRTTKAAIKIAVDMAGEGLISKEEAILRANGNGIEQLLHSMLDPSSKKILLDTGLPASPGAATGGIAFSPKAVVEMSKSGKSSILARIETSPEDIEGMNLAEGILTTRGGMTSHAAVVARGMGKPCITSVKALNISYEEKTVTLPSGEILKEGEIITLDGGNGEVYKGEVRKIEPELSPEFKELMNWADEIRTLKIRANAETAKDAQTALKFGAEGIGLCRTEHMFFEKDRIVFVRQMILSENFEERKASLEKLLPFQIEDFTEIFSIMKGKPVNIRLLDPPLHEFLPAKQEEIEELSKQLDIPSGKLSTRIEALHETNPMLGHRGARLGITYPEIYEMQVRAIFMAARGLLKKGTPASSGAPTDISSSAPEIKSFNASASASASTFASSVEAPLIEIMLPLIITLKEVEILEKMIRKIAGEFEGVKYTIGTMIETPRAALMGEEIAKVASFFSFGTNDLTQMTLGISRDDSSNFVPSYIKSGIFQKDPFVQLDVEGVGKLIKMAIEEGRKTRPELKASICGEHGGDPFSIHFARSAGMNYVSCSPYRIPAARLAAAAAEIMIKSPDTPL